MLVTKVAWCVTAQKSKGSMHYNGGADPSRPKSYLQQTLIQLSSHQ